jgi:hypothetical protein
MDALLELTPRIRAGVKYADGTFKSERHFLDFVVNGQSLWEALGKRHDMVSILCLEFPPDESAKAIKRLLLNEKADLPNSRRSLFVCSECGDIGCGQITTIIDKKERTISWKDFGYENNYEDKIDLASYETFGPLTFDKVAYERTLLSAMDYLERL